jgi:hypothetical protein
MDRKQLTRYVIDPVLQGIELFSPSARDLILGTCQQESQMGQYIAQNGGPALGIYQCEPNTLKDIWTNWLKYNAFAFANLIKVSNASGLRIDVCTDPNLLVYNLNFATAICRFHYERVKQEIPINTGNKQQYIQDLANYYKTHYNTALGAANMSMVIANFNTVVNNQ